MPQPLRILAIDIGTGTQDILLFEKGKAIENNFQIVMPSPTVIIAERVRRATVQGRPILLTGVVMGGGPCHWAVRDHAQAGHRVVVSESAARTFDDDLTMVAGMGFEIVSDHDAAPLQQSNDLLHIEMQDLDAQALITAFQAFDLSPQVDALALAAFDHGAAPPGVSDRRFRFAFIEQTIQRQPVPSAFAYLSSEIPSSLTRLQALTGSAARYIALSGSAHDIPVLLMDTGSAAALGALEDPHVRAQSEAILCNIGNFHTLAFHLQAGKIVGIFEHHTGELTLSQLELFLRKLADGTLDNEEIFHSNGHGSLLLPARRSTSFPFLAVTGPRRALLAGSQLQPYLATPHGDMMMAGCYGLLRALADQRADLAPAIEAALLA